MADDTKKKPRPCVLFLRGLSVPVKNLFRAKCVARQLTMTDVVEALMRFYMENPGLVEPYVEDVLRSRKKAKGKR